MSKKKNFKNKHLLKLLTFQIYVFLLNHILARKNPSKETVFPIFTWWCFLKVLTLELTPKSAPALPKNFLQRIYWLQFSAVKLTSNRPYLHIHVLRSSFLSGRRVFAIHFLMHMWIVHMWNVCKIPLKTNSCLEQVRDLRGQANSCTNLTSLILPIKIGASAWQYSKETSFI